MNERSNLAALSRALKGLADRSSSAVPIPISKDQLQAWARTIDRALAVDTWEQPSLAEWRDQVIRKKETPSA